MTLSGLRFKLISPDGETRPSLAAFAAPLSAKADSKVDTAPTLPPRDFDAGYARGAADERAAIAGALHALDACKSTLELQLAGLEETYRKRCAALLAQILKAAIPPISEAAARATIARLFEDATGKPQHANVAIVAAPDIHDALQAFCEQFDPAISMQSDLSLAPGTLQARWNSGGIDCDVGRSLFAIVELLNSGSGLNAKEPSS
ncbi:MAG: hypothetical protein ACKVS5_09200 [Parvularculaceae bacterium]